MSEAGPENRVAGVKLSHPDRVLFKEQGITKRDLARYFEKVAPVMLPEIGGRLVSLVRCPDGRDGQCFFQRHAGAGISDHFETRRIEERGEGKGEAYLLLPDAGSLVAAAQFGVLEIHIWGSTVDDIERPNRLVFDLDPGEGVPFPEVRRAAHDLRRALDAVGLRAVPMLTGGKGIHVVVPVARRHEWPVVKDFCRALAARLAGAAPDRFVATAAKAKRRGRIFIDYLRNDRSASAVAPFSPRARKGAPVAWPVEWSALDRFGTGDAVKLDDVLSGRRRPARWKDYPSRQNLSARALRAFDVEPA